MSDASQTAAREDRPEDRILEEFGYQLAEIRQTGRPQPAIIVVGDTAEIPTPVMNKMRNQVLEHHDHWITLDAGRAEDLIQAVELADGQLSSGWSAPDDNHEVFEQTIRRWCAHASDNDHILVLQIANIDNLTLGEVCAIGATLQTAVIDRWPLLPILTGTQKLRNLVARGPGYLERGNWIDLDN